MKKCDEELSDGNDLNLNHVLFDYLGNGSCYAKPVAF